MQLNGNKIMKVDIYSDIKQESEYCPDCGQETFRHGEAKHSADCDCGICTPGERTVYFHAHFPCLCAFKKEVKTMFHAQDGLHFERQEDGSVKVIVVDDKVNSSKNFETTLPPSSWASVVASVCSEGETHRTWRMASVFHDSNV